VFADERGEALTPNGRPRHAFRRAAQRAGLAEPLPKLHDLRHAYASALLAAGLTVHAVAELLGHSSPALVMARYGHAYADEKAASAMALERLVAARS
jgi:integrase